MKNKHSINFDEKLETGANTNVIQVPRKQPRQSHIFQVKTKINQIDQY